MAKLQYTRFENIFESREIAINKLNEISRNFAEPVMIRYYGTDKNIKTMVALFRSESIGDYVLQYDEEKDGSVTDLEDLINQMLDFNKPLVSPVIKGNWSYFNNSDYPLVINPAPDSKNPIIERGYKAKFIGVYSWNSELGKKNPTKVSSDSNWTDLPKEGISSNSYSSEVFTRNGKITAGIQAPKTGLIVVGDSVRLAEGDDKSYDSRTVTFLERIYYGTLETNEIGESEIKTLSGTKLSGNRESTITNISTGSSEYYVYAYPKIFGDLSQIIQNYSLPVLGAFTKKEITITNGAGIQVELLVYVSNNPGAFTNVVLQFK